MMVPPMLVALVKSSSLEDHDLSSVKIIFCGAAPLSTAMAEKFLRNFHVSRICLCKRILFGLDLHCLLVII